MALVTSLNSSDSEFYILSPNLSLSSKAYISNYPLLLLLLLLSHFSHVQLCVTP